MQELRRLYIVVAAACMSLGAAGQDFVSDMHQLSKRILEAKRLHMVMQVSLYADAGSVAPFRIERSDLRKKGALMHTDLVRRKMLVADEGTISVDTTQRQIVFVPSTKRAQPQAVPIDPVSDSLLRVFGARAQRLGTEKGITRYSIAMDPGGWVAQLVYHVRESDGMLTQFTYYYNREKYPAAYRADVVFEKIDTHPWFWISDFSVKQYIRRKGTQWVVAPAYEGYSLYIATAPDAEHQ